MIRPLVRELCALDETLADWDGMHPPKEHLLERAETVEANLSEIETRLHALRELE